MSRSSHLIFLLLLVSGVSSDSASAQPDRTKEELEQAKKKFEQEIFKLDEDLLANIDKALKKSDKKLEDKLTYERPLFVIQHIIPAEKAIAGPTNTYLANRAKAEVDPKYWTKKGHSLATLHPVVLTVILHA